jgi:hypothetical protein
MKKVLFLLLLSLMFSCLSSSEQSEMELCFEGVKHRIKSDTILNKIKHCPLDSFGYYGGYIYGAVINEPKSSPFCSKALKTFLVENPENTNLVNNLIQFQHFQAYLRNEKFDKVKAMQNALKFERENK